MNESAASSKVALTEGSVFRDSLERYMQNLDPADADWLGQITQTSWEPVVSQLEALSRSNKDSSITRRLLSRIRCFTDSLRPFFGCIDVIVNSCGQIVGVVWGALKVVIEITHKFTEYFSIISDTLETISVELPIFQDYVEKLYTESNTVQKAVVVVFEDILSVFLLVRKNFINTKGQPRSLFGISAKVFRQDMEVFTAHLEKHRKNVQVHVDHAERMANKEEREKSTQARRRLEAKILSDEKRASEIMFYQRIEKFQALLDAPKCWEKHATVIQIYKQPQCWLLNNAQYKEWCNKSCGLLWCHGKPGAGKTVLSSVIIDDLQQRYRQDPSITVVFFYCEYDDLNKRQTSKIVASILDQLMYNPKVLSLVKETWMDQSPNLQHLGLENLQDLILQLLRQSHRTYIIVDALDECDHPEDVADILGTLAKHSSVLVTSRSESEDIATILGHEAQIHITAEKLQADIEYFVAFSLEKHRRLSKRSAEIKQHIAKVLSSAADGMQVPHIPISLSGL
ncbi:Ankyrin [Mycena venus]|uniref:Ankyrin n=1 Tax=Mycena venus TaxID=2733690 RepID=A0A8H6XLU3_9AGAR|nr:Ankyrin [Mycena venus]